MISRDQVQIIFWQRLAISIPCIATICAIILSYLLGVSWSYVDCVNVLLVASFPLAVGFNLLWLGRLPAIAAFVTISGLVIVLTMVEAAIALMGTRSPVPIADDWLAAADALLPVSAMDIIVGTQRLPSWAIWVLKKAYLQTGSYLFGTLIFLLLSDRTTLAWRMFVIWGWSFLLISLIAFAAPALGSFSQLSAAQVEHLPKGAGRFAMKTFHEFRNATHPVLSTGHVSAVVTFPSFHTVCALLLAQAWHGIRIVGPLIKVLAVLIVFSCMPIGGHYLIDLIAGAAVWWAVTLALDRYSKANAADVRKAEIALSAA